jgi:hypothetical protein
LIAFNEMQRQLYNQTLHGQTTEEWYTPGAFRQEFVTRIIRGVPSLLSPVLIGE